ncbi:MAG: bifunctional riboflavin kinase/FAD synthetase [Chloroherpetonaceae bacterium]|nr:bifunctional riboflavin kinase/FAD synthetase [Chloroherpetonaceae bacterium]MCS7211764.1 bifunctional riboflavin kinase/FAD synthetase [Chloroherpetonaceae bacterium]MDW8018759.1 bifunctional riboflavin kinase/FAD synthetase [Chloroherpetonaceae bacterium]
MQILHYRHRQLLTEQGEVLPPLAARSSAITIGAFDGVHLGHRHLLGRLLGRAKSEGLRSVVITFEPHPRTIVAKPESKPLRLLSTPEEKIALLSTLEIDTLIVVEFTKAFSELSPEAFVEEILLREFGLSAMVIGYDHGFGKDRKGTMQTLLQLSQQHGFTMEVVEEFSLDGRHISSSQIRALVAAGQLSEANLLLGSPYRLTGKVVHGERRGRLIGFPTANLEISHPIKLIPHIGVYAADVSLATGRYRAMVNIGYRPTVSNLPRLQIEAHILNFSGDLYGATLTLELLQRLRDEQKFPSLEALKAQLEEDKRLIEAVPSFAATVMMS